MKIRELFKTEERRAQERRTAMIGAMTRDEQWRYLGLQLAHGMTTADIEEMDQIERRAEARLAAATGPQHSKGWLAPRHRK